jgi:hypothetical protein
MKWIVYFLLLANVAFFARQYHQMSNTPPPPQQAVRPYDHVNRLLLISETSAERLRVRVPASKPAPRAAVEKPLESMLPPATTAAIPVQNCYSVGPLEEETQVAAVRAWLLAIGGDPVLRLDERRELERYWVYFPPLPSQEQAVQEVERMRAQGIEDVIAVTKGDTANAISLGVFSQRGSLERRLQELRALGYDPLVMPRYSTEKVSWFDVRFEQGESLTPNDLGARFPEVELHKANCISGEIARDGPDS